MRKEKTKAYCRRCRHEQIFVRAKMHHLMHFIFSVLTLGLWSISWLALYIGQRVRPWRCEHCHWNRPEFAADRKSGHPVESGTGESQAQG